MQGELTRRRLIAHGAAGAALGLLGSVPDTLAAAGADPAVRSFWLDAGDQSATGPRALRAPARFDLVGFGWEGPSPLRGDVRVRRDGAPWSAWRPLPTGDHDREAGDAALAPGGPRVTDPLWVGGADGLELRLRRGVRRLRIHFVNSTGTATPAARRRTALARALAGEARLAAVRPVAGAPPIVPRSVWAGRSADPSAPPVYGEVAFAAVHHTESLGGYGPGDSAAMILAIARYHRDVKHWDDIGYNFVVDRFGRIFEGRAGGVLEAVAGAHAGGFNQSSTGTAVLGSFTGVAPSPAAMQALARLLAWKMSLHATPIEGRVVVLDRGTAPNKYRPGDNVRVPRIAGHRDLNATDCPGGQLYRRLPELRRRVKRLASAQPHPSGPLPALAAAAPAVHRGQPLGLGGAAGGVAGALSLQIERQTRYGYARTTAALALAPDRTFATPITLPRTGAYRLSVRGTDPHGLPLLSPPVYVTVQA